MSKALPVSTDIQTRLWDRKNSAKGSQDHGGERPHRSAWAIGGAESKRKCSINVC